MNNAPIILGLLRRSGFTFLKWGNPKNLLIPKDKFNKVEEQFYEMLKKYSFRIFLKDIIRLNGL